MKILIGPSRHLKFKPHHAGLLSVVAIFVIAAAIITQNLFYILSILIIGFFAIYINKRSLRRIIVSMQQFPADWRSFLNSHSPYYPFLPLPVRKRFERDIKFILTEIKMRVKGIKTANLSMDTRLFIAMGMATLLIGRPEWELPLPREIIILPGNRMNKNMKTDNGTYAALATREALYLTEDNLVHSFARSEDGYNIIFHEMAHYFDVESGVFSGAPSYHRFSKNQRQQEAFNQWLKVMDREMEKTKNGTIHLRNYAVQNRGEFFACATEIFFEQPDKLKNESDDLYNLLKAFFNFDPLQYRRTTRQKVTA